MKDFSNNTGLCNICREARTTIHAEVAPGQVLYVCDKCLEMAKQNFIWICMHCGSVHIRSKSLVLQRLKDPELRAAYARCEDMQLIQGIDMCIECEPAAVLEFVTSAKGAGCGGCC